METYTIGNYRIELDENAEKPEDWDHWEAQGTESYEYGSTLCDTIKSAVGEAEMTLGEELGSKDFPELNLKIVGGPYIIVTRSNE